jgi:prepilin-type N-terminal cleavage/methylation domain-containing protein
MQRTSCGCNAFTLAELLVVIAIILVLIGLAFPAFIGAQNQAKKVQAKNDLIQIVTAVNAFYTEYGRYPVAGQNDVTFTNDNSDLFYALRAVSMGANSSDALNPRKILFISPPDVKDPNKPRGGIAPTTGIYYDPWGKEDTLPEGGIYHVRIDGNYNDIVANAYTDGSAGGDPGNSYSLRQGVIAWSLGKDKTPGRNANNSFTNSDDVISWQ